MAAHLPARPHLDWLTVSHRQGSRPVIGAMAAVARRFSTDPTVVGYVGEFGNSASDDDVLLAGSTAAADRALSGESMWDWKSQCGAGTSPKDCQNAWSVYAGDPSPIPAQNGPIIPTRERYLSRAFPLATVGHLDSLVYDPQRRRLSMNATATHTTKTSGSSRPTVIFLPSTMTGNVTVSGAAVLTGVTREPDGTYRAFVAPNGAGVYSVAAS
ncbi:MAG: hypothetical protein NVS3B12_13580 [Acidimicrobiales bacterium]